MRKMNFLDDLQFVAAAERDGSRGPFADSVHGENQSVFERRGIKGARRMALMMFGE